MLTQSDITLLQAAYAKLQAGDIAGARAQLATLPEAKLQHPDVVHLLALIMIETGETGEAREFLEYAVKAAPESFSIWMTYANLLGDVGAFDAAVDAYDHAAALDPQSADPWLNLGLTAMSAERLDIADNALTNASRLAPGSNAIWNARGVLEQQHRQPDVAIGHYQQALMIDERDARSRHNLGSALRDIDQPAAAIDQVELAIGLGSMAPESFTLRAHLLADLGRFDEAVGQYREVIKAVPDYLDAQETLARLLPQVGQGDAALEGYRIALAAGAPSPALWQSALAAAKDVGDAQQLLGWAEDAERALGPQIDCRLARATALCRMGDAKAALAVLEPLANQSPDNAAVRAHLAHILLLLGDPAQAERHALRATELAPLDQLGWSFLTIIWRLLDDPRERWLADYDRLVMPIDLIMSDDLAALATTVEALHLTAEHPAEQSLRGGTQTRGNIFDKRNPDMRGFATQVRTAVAARLTTLPNDPTHPFLGRNSGAIDFAGSWSVRLRSAGFHTNHIHQMGWLSSAFYVSLPAEVGASSDVGALTFGVPDAAYGLDLTPRRIERPRAGRLVLFPSYFWHGTVPFDSQSPRLTMAFDAVPA